jgi:putative tricarboxylic transport membrane protein
MVLALVLGDMAEASFRQAMLISQGSLAIFWSNPLVGSITALAIALLLWPLWGAARNLAKAREVAVSGA